MERQIAAALLGLAAGILLAAFTPLQWSAVFALLLGAFLLGAFFLKYRSAGMALCAVFLVGCAVGVARVSIMVQELPGAFEAMVGTDVELEGVVVAEPDIRETTQRIVIKTKKDGETARILVVAQKYPAVSYGETVRATGTLAAPEPFDTGGGRTFAYDRFLAKDEVFAVLEQSEVEVTAPREGAYSVRGILSDIKTGGIDALTKALPEPHASLAAGLLLGGKQGLGEELLDDFIRSGLVHIVVLSGYNVMIVAEFVLRGVRLVSRRYAVIVSVLTIGVFVVMAGAGAASIRAGLMAGIALFARSTGRVYDAARALCIAGAAMLLLNPLVLPYDPGFQLSFLATLGLIFGAPIVERWLAFVRSAFLREICAATIAAQIFVLPLLLYQSGLLSLASLPANIAVLPFVPLAMLLSFVALIGGAIAPPLAPVIGFPAYLSLSYIIMAAQTASALPFGALTLPAFPFALVLASYVALAYAVVRLTTPQLLQGVSRTHST